MLGSGLELVAGGEALGADALGANALAAAPGAEAPGVAHPLAIKQAASTPEIASRTRRERVP